ncbi:MAG: FHA domain-containing protein [Pseudomonadota bacterium]
MVMANPKIFSLKIIEGNNVDSIFELEEGVKYEFRRASPDGIPTNIERKRAIFLMDTEVSKLHANIMIVSGELVVQDLGSTNGVYVNGKRVAKSLLVNNDRLKIGVTVFLVTVITDSVLDSRTFIGRAPSEYSKQTHEFKKLAKIMDEKIVFEPNLRVELPYQSGTNAGNMYLELLDLAYKNKMTEEMNSPQTTGLLNGYLIEVKIINGENQGDILHFYKKSIVVGRTRDVWLKDSSVSREHAEITVAGSKLFRIKDLGSQNGTFINDQKVQMATFRENDIIRLGDTMLSFSYIDEDF